MLTAISGCSGSGAGTYACEPATDVLYFTGTGLLTLNAISYTLYLGAGNPAQLQAGTGIVATSDTSAQLFLNHSYGVVLEEAQYNATVHQLYVEMGSWSYVLSAWQYVTSNAFNVSFIPLPPPVLLGIAQGYGGCAPSTTPLGSAVWVGCFPLLSWVDLAGHYMYNGSLSIGAPNVGYFPCTVRTVQDATLTSWWLPLVVGLPSGELLDLVFTSPYGSSTLHQVVAYTNASILGSIDPCVNPGQCTSASSTHHCAPMLLS